MPLTLPKRIRKSDSPSCLSPRLRPQTNPTTPPQGNEHPGHQSGAEADVVADQVNPAPREHGNDSHQDPKPSGEDDSRQADQQPEPEHVATRPRHHTLLMHSNEKNPK